MGEVSDPHDRFFKERLSDPATAREFLSEYLPPSLRDCLDLRELRVERDSFVDERLRGHRSDLVCRVELACGGDAFVYVLFEHKSWPDPGVALQLLRYVTRLWVAVASGSPGAPLPPVIPVVVYHGRTPWRVPRRLSDLVRAPAALRPFVVDFRYHLTDLTRYSDEGLRGTALLRVALLCLRHVFDEDLADRLPGILALLGDVLRSRSGIEALEAVLSYLGSAASDRVDPDGLQRAVLPAFPVEGEEIMSTLHGEWIEKGRRVGREEGALLTARRVVVEVLRVRFGEVEASVVDAVEGLADLSALEVLHRHAVTVGSLDEFLVEVERVDS